MSTAEQILDRARFKNHLQREGLSGVLNDTKWTELFHGMITFRTKTPLAFQRKDVRDPEPSEEYWDLDLYNAFSGWSSIEWLKIKSESIVKRGRIIDTVVENHNSDLVAAVKLLGIPFEAKESHIVIYGYIRPGATPEWSGK